MTDQPTGLRKHIRLTIDRSFIVNATFLALFIGAVVVVTVLYAPQLTRMASDPESFRKYILSHGGTSALVFILFQVLQVVIAVIPGELVQIAGGYIYGTALGTFYSLVGIMAGYVIVFGIVRLFGYRLVKQVVSEEDLRKFHDLINSNGSEITIFLLFLTPGVPKDILVYIAGLTPVHPLAFFVIVTLARLPAMLGASYIGANLQQRDYTMAIVMSVLAFVLFVLGLLLKDRLIALAHRVFHRDGGAEH